MIMDLEIIRSVILNIGLLVILALLLTQFSITKRFITGEKKTLSEQVFLMALFGVMGIVSTITGYEVSGAIANTRVISVMAGGLIGGPVVGIGASVIAGLHRYFSDVGGLTALSCAISTMAEGVLSAFFYTRIKAKGYQESHVFLLTFAAELLQMALILLIARPFDMAYTLVRAIFVPMVMFNSVGMVFFMSIFKSIFTEQAYEIGKNTTMTFEITRKCLPYLAKGTYDKESLFEIAKTIVTHSGHQAAVFTQGEKLLTTYGELNQKDLMVLETFAKKIYEEKSSFLYESSGTSGKRELFGKSKVYMGSPIFKNRETLGTLIVVSSKTGFSIPTGKEFVEGLTQFFSVQYDLAELDHQKALLHKVEYRALQSQINPHFIFNSLNTISAFTREKPEKARDLLIALAAYFRNSIKTQDGFVSIYEELEYVNAYLELEKARFEDRLEVTLSIEDHLKMKVPCLILQPIVENAILHGAMKRKKGIVHISVESIGEDVEISIKDNGQGIPEKVLEALREGETKEFSIGLFNVEKRLRYLYGKDRGLKIQTGEEGTKVTITLPKVMEKEYTPVFA
ncbi:MAG TPA: sensor histidine kinase [Proteiniclasticum sp.]|nr:sensor histidine kinase [Proteiniclasticum sp.]